MKETKRSDFSNKKSWIRSSQKRLGDPVILVATGQTYLRANTVSFPTSHKNGGGMKKTKFNSGLLRITVGVSTTVLFWLRIKLENQTDSTSASPRNFSNSVSPMTGSLPDFSNNTRCFFQNWEGTKFQNLLWQFCDNWKVRRPVADTTSVFSISRKVKEFSKLNWP